MKNKSKLDDVKLEIMGHNIPIVIESVTTQATPNQMIEYRVELCIADTSKSFVPLQGNRDTYIKRRDDKIIEISIPEEVYKKIEKAYKMHYSGQTNGK